MKKALFLLFSWQLFCPLVYPGTPELGTKAQREAGKNLYQRFCGQCHGVQGDGKGIAAPYFTPAPRDFTRGAFKIRTTESGSLPTTEDVKNIIRQGMPYTGMPAWPQLREEELTNLAYYLKTFSEDFADPEANTTPMAIPEPPPYSEASAREGRKVYEANKCVDCHGQFGRGNGESAPTLKDDWKRPIKAADLTKKWTFRGGSTRKDIYRTFTTGLNGAPMPSYADSIPEKQRWQLVDYVYSLSRANGPGYANLVIAEPVEEIDLSQAPSLFDKATRAVFPMVGQVMEPGRAFSPSADEIEVRAVYHQDRLAVMLTWHDRSAEVAGRNHPSMPVAEEENAQAFSDAVAVQFPSQVTEGLQKPYFLFGDPKNSVQLWFSDLARGKGEVFTGKGSDAVTPNEGGELTAISQYEHGQWRVVFLGKIDAGFQEQRFVPIAFSLWDGFQGERGNKRGLTSWYNLYLRPANTPSPLVPMLFYGCLVVLLEVLIVLYVRRKYRFQRILW